MRSNNSFNFPLGLIKYIVIVIESLGILLHGLLVSGKFTAGRNTVYQGQQSLSLPVALTDTVTSLYANAGTHSFIMTSLSIRPVIHFVPTYLEGNSPFIKNKKQKTHFDVVVF